MLIKLSAYLFLTVALFAAYWFLIRPLLKARPGFSDFYDKTESWWAALRMKLSSIKTKLLATSLIIANGFISLHDFLLPAMTGVDWTPLTQRVPSWALPLIAMVVGALFLWLRKITADAEAQKLVAVETGALTATQVIKADAAEVEMVVQAVVVPEEMKKE